ncbi:Fe-S-containing protein [Chloroflexota bacterium]
MLVKIITIVTLISLIIGVTACTGTTTVPPENETTPLPINPTPTQPSGLIKATWIEPQVNDTSVTIPLSEVEDNWITHFEIETGNGTQNFMSYILEGTTYVRANVCPPCKSIGYSLFGDILVCDRCATTFEATTGDGIDGACVDFPKAMVSYEITDGDIIMDEANLVTAYQNTLEPGLP